MQLRRILLLLALLGVAPARAEDALDGTVTWFQERRAGTNQALNVYHPQADFAVDLGQHTTFSGGYEADVVSGATFSLYAYSPMEDAVDVVTSATEFSDTRHAGHASLSFRGRRSSLRLAYGYGTERDYRSHTISGGATVDLPGKNTTFGVSYARNLDRVCDRNNGDATPLERRALGGGAEDACFTDQMEMGERITVTHDVDIDTAEATVTQNVSPTMVLQLGLYGQIVRGFQSNPYRRVRVAGSDAQEHTPDVRSRGAAFARANLAFPAAHAALSLSLRGYSDTWGVNSGTAEMAYSQYVGRSLLVRARARVYQQSGAVFFLNARDYLTGGPNGEFWTGDRELAPLRDVLVGIKLSYLKAGESGEQVWGAFDALDFHLKVDGIWGTPLTAYAPGGDTTGLRPDQLVLQLGLGLEY